MNDLLNQVQNLAGTAANAFIQREVGRVNTRAGGPQIAPTPDSGGKLPKWLLPVGIGGAVLLLVVVFATSLRGGK